MQADEIKTEEIKEGNIFFKVLFHLKIYVSI